MADPDETFIAESENKIKEIVHKLGWDLKNFTENLEPVDYVDCPNDKKHRIRKNKLQEHLEKCDLVSEGYTADDPPFPVSFPCRNFVTLTPQLQDKIIADGGIFSVLEMFFRLLRAVPQSSNRLFRDFTREERLAIYEYVRQQTSSGLTIPDEELVTQERKEEKRELSSVEKAILERDARRRRTTYRNKVHLNNKSHTEIMREVIASQMEDMVNSKNCDQGTSQNEKLNRSDDDDKRSERRKKRKRDRTPEKRHKRHKDRHHHHHKKKKKEHSRERTS